MYSCIYNKYNIDIIRRPKHKLTTVVFYLYGTDSQPQINTQNLAIKYACVYIIIIIYLQLRLIGMIN